MDLSRLTQARQEFEVIRLWSPRPQDPTYPEMANMELLAWLGWAWQGPFSMVKTV